MKRPPIWFVLSLILFIFSIFLLSNQTARQSIAKKLFSSERTVLSVVTADVLRNKQLFRVIKVLDADGISVEVYAPAADGAWALWDKIALPDRKDGYFHLFSQATNLALKDLDSDGTYEILAPTYDRDMTPHLNALKLNVERKKLESYTGNTP